MGDDMKNEATGEKQRKVGVYICYCGGNISDHVYVEKVRESVEKMPLVSVARTNMFMCSDPGQEMIMEDLKSGAVDRVVVASCAPSLHQTTFRNAVKRAGFNPYIYEHANIREHVSWVHNGDSATEKAARLVSAAVAKANLLEPLEPIRVDAIAHAAVIGGGMAGMKAATDLADKGVKVTIIEKSPFLGGNVAKLDRLAPSNTKAADLLTSLATNVLANPLITVHSCSTVQSYEGYVGNFKLGIKKCPPDTGTDKDGCSRNVTSGMKTGAYIPFAGVLPDAPPSSEENITIDAGVIILATGFKPYTPRNGEYGYSDYPEVITLPELIQLMATGKNSGDRLVVNGREIRSMAMIHCVGSRHIPGIHTEDEAGNLNEYCSRTCCAATLNAANNIKEAHPGTSIYEFYRDIRTYGRGQEELYSRASKNKVVFIRFEADAGPEVTSKEAPGDYPLLVRAKDTLTFGEEVAVPVDLVVLATGMEPAAISDLVTMMKLPVGADRFLQEVHPKLRPVELPKAGIYLAGTCQAPMDTGEVSNAAGAAAAKAASLLGKGHVDLDPFVASVDADKCKGTGECVKACLVEGALGMADYETEDGEKKQIARVEPAMCTGCGACVAVCPDNAIDISGWTLEQYEAMVDWIVADIK